MTTDLVAELEDLVDRHSLTEVLDALSAMCREKAEHLRSNWQDNVTAKVWDRNANRIDKLVSKVEL